MKKFKVVLNKDTCIACGVCPSIAPQIFEMGKVKANLVGMEDKAEGIQERELKPDEVVYARNASEACPTASIKVEEISDDT